MNRYEKSFADARRGNKIALIPFAVAGDPDCGLSESVFKTYIDAGADILEIGYPFSDPIADGPVNQRAAMRAIDSGLTPKRFFTLIKNLRAYSDIPFGLLVYANTVHHYGAGAFCQHAADAGIDSVLVADMPPEESSALRAMLKIRGLSSVYIVSELTPADRIRYICKRVSGFIYVVSRLGPTGAQLTLAHSVAGTLSRLRKICAVPLCVGFGLSKPEHVTQVHEAGAQGAIVGSALVSIIESNAGDRHAMLKNLYSAVKALKHAA